MDINQARQWQNVDLEIASGVKIIKLTTYQSSWNHLLNGDGIEKETGIKFGASFLFDSPSITATKIEDASQILISKIRDYHTRLFTIIGVYLIHIRVIPTNRSSEQDARYAPYFYAQALVDVSGGPKIIH